MKYSIMRDKQFIDRAIENMIKHSRREQERSRTPRFILVHASSRATSSPLQPSKEFPL